MINGIGSGTGALIGGSLIGGGLRGEALNRNARTRTDGQAAPTMVAQIAAEGAPVETDRVAALRAAIKAGSYRPNAEAIASAMIAQDIDGTTAAAPSIGSTGIQAGGAQL